jgi:hypothetical protein
MRPSLHIAIDRDLVQAAPPSVNLRAYASQTAMPTVGVDEAQARDIAAYLYLR